ncbi:serine threonine kinase-like domain-containing STKLD1 [Pelobates cultripes]|uniref:non-specific serine/threonine protein kinase n=1 Tax=Pelobates cultripes TaxID=61616 RepID=A0AAD1WK76_PELCU|nr:serine threonine kinase-like domain-containing STKLD1 [Pelobates cultripes]
MEKYKILEEWRPGTFGETCIGEEIGSKKKCVLKKVECMDEQEANLALKEFMVLLDLHHPNICPYKEFFITWDNKISSLFLYLVMDYSDNGHLDVMLQEYRQAKTKIDEKTIQLFLGQMIDVLVYIHKQKVLHRNLKPSNILIKGKDTFLISDFLVETLVMDEMKLKIRVYPESKLFMAPETTKFSFSEKSDVWSIGSIILDVMTCASHTETESSTLLQVIKADPSGLERVLNTLQHETGYSSELCEVLQRMLQICPEDRITESDLVNHPYIKICLTFIGSPLAGIKKRLPPELADKMQETENVSVAPSLSVTEYMEKYSEYEEAQMSALKHLSSRAAHPDGLPCEGELVRLIEQAMRLHADSLDIQLEGSKILKHIVRKVLKEGEGGDGFVNNELLTTLVGAVRRFHESKELAFQILSVLATMSANNKTAELLEKNGFLQDVVKILEDSQDSTDLCTPSCDLLWSMAMTERPSDVELLKYSVEVILSLIRNNLYDVSLMTSAFYCLWILCLKGYVSEKQIEPVIFVCLECYQHNRIENVLIKNICLILANLVRNYEMAAYQAILPVSGWNCIHHAKDIYRYFSWNPEIVENICILFNEMAQYEFTLPELRSFEIDEIMQEVKVKNDGIREIMVLADSILRKMKG